MIQARFFMLTVVLGCCLVTGSCAQTVSKDNAIDTFFYVGSTPCDSLMRSLLKIPSASISEFVKWELRLTRNVPGKFKLTALYGQGQNGTNGFIGGGKKITAAGNYTIGTGAVTNPKGRIFQLHADAFSAPLLLVEMDNNILHFADSNKKLITGNGGFGYVLNRFNP